MDAQMARWIECKRISEWLVRSLIYIDDKIGYIVVMLVPVSDCKVTPL